MFTEYWSAASWQTIIPGVRVCAIAPPASGQRLSRELPIQLAPSCVEVLFCLGGTLTLQRKSGGTVQLSAQEILLLSHCENLARAELQLPLAGFCLSVDHTAARNSFAELCRSYGGLSLSMQQIGALLDRNGGFRVIPATPWSRTAFSVLNSLPEADRGRYCVMKCFELLYLLCVHAPGTEGDRESRMGYLSGVAAQMKAYLEAHLDEKLTIKDLSRQFHLSPTACKSCFRTCFGQPIHAWLLDRRIEHAAELLQRTQMPILQVAQAVGYSGVSQFNVAFRQRYGQSPSAYRKMSASRN